MISDEWHDLATLPSISDLAVVYRFCSLLPCSLDTIAVRMNFNGQYLLRKIVEIEALLKQPLIERKHGQPIRLSPNATPYLERIRNALNRHRAFFAEAPHRLLVRIVSHPILCERVLPKLLSQTQESLTETNSNNVNGSIQFQVDQKYISDLLPPIGPEADFDIMFVIAPAGHRFGRLAEEDHLRVPLSWCLMAPNNTLILKHFEEQSFDWNSWCGPSGSFEYNFIHVETPVFASSMPAKGLPQSNTTVLTFAIAHELVVSTSVASRIKNLTATFPFLLNEREEKLADIIPGDVDVRQFGFGPIELHLIRNRYAIPQHERGDSPEIEAYQARRNNVIDACFHHLHKQVQELVQSRQIVDLRATIHKGLSRYRLIAHTSREGGEFHWALGTVRLYCTTTGYVKGHHRYRSLAGQDRQFLLFGRDTSSAAREGKRDFHFLVRGQDRDVEQYTFSAVVAEHDLGQKPIISQWVGITTMDGCPSTLKPGHGFIVLLPDDEHVTSAEWSGSATPEQVKHLNRMVETFARDCHIAELPNPGNPKVRKKTR